MESVITLPNDPVQVSFTRENAKEMLRSPLYQNPLLSNYLTVTDRYKVGQQLAFSNPLGLTGRAGTCGAVTDEPMSFFEKVLDPKKIKGGWEQCEDEIHNSLFLFTAGDGYGIYNLGENPAYEDLMSYYLIDAFLQNLQRRVWFNDTSILDSDLNGNGIYFNTYDGLFKLFINDASINGNRVEISENDGLNYASQELAADTAYKTFQAMVRTADPRLRSKMPPILCTSTLFFNYKEYLENQSLQFTLDRVEGGFQRLTYNGLQVIDYNLWDRNIEAYFNDGTRYDRPHRAVMMDKQNVIFNIDVGLTPRSSAFQIYYSLDDEVYKMKWASLEDVQFGYSFMIKGAW